MKLCTVIVLLDPIQARFLPSEGPGGSLTLFDMGGHDGPSKMFLTTVPKGLGGGS